MKVSEFDYHLPEEFIAQRPIEPRDASRLLVIDRLAGCFEHAIFHDLPRYLDPGDCLVVNDTRVLPARLLGCKKETGGKVEILLLRELGDGRWEALVRPGRRLAPGVKITFGQRELAGRIEARLPGGRRIISFDCTGDFMTVLHKLGKVPLPPYIHEELVDGERYQTIFARKEESVAAPTAALHFTPVLLKKIEEMGVHIATVTLRVGLDTFRPIREEEVEEHGIHREHFKVDGSSAKLINRAIKESKRILAVGTTSARVLEAVAIKEGRRTKVEAKEGETDLFIYPGYEFKVVDALITNFHLPRSTLLLLVSAFAGRDLIMRAYQEAIERRYRFFSFGDAMLIL
ncbi:MAG: tRNA preQ1(34) S-adenosylmethionine ribosyltransferase-isomerase QueA [Actinomycetota bacterium]|nr:tRNA preQ1(34) S-adenosylmethionine ribosyltransferase-isomerase QueA [Actinomycetota bacterium]